MGAFWVSFNSLTAAAKFVNEMRESVVTGSQGTHSLTIEHRKVLLFDWILSMSGTITAAFLYSGIIFWIAWVLKEFVTVAYVWIAVGTVGIFPLLGGFMFIACGICDYRVMRRTLKQAEHVITMISGV